MQTMLFVTRNEKVKDGELPYTLWCKTNRLDVFRDFMQYVLDNCSKPEEFMIIDTSKDLVYDMYRCATEQYQMRKRTFYERLDNIQTGKWKGADLTILETA